MRRFTLLGTFFVLMAAVFFLWQYRFERSADFPTYRLSDLRKGSMLGSGAEWIDSEKGPKLRLRVDQAHSGIVARMEFPQIAAISALHVRFQVSAKNLAPGKEFWEDGRSMIEWHSKGGGPDYENDGFFSVQHDQISDVTECVLRPEFSSAMPVLRIENLGSTGEMELSMFEATVLQERVIWKIGRWFLMAAWIIWIAAWIGPVGEKRFVRPLLAGTVWIVVAIYFVVPGPWKILHSFEQPFQIGPEIRSVYHEPHVLDAGVEAQSNSAGQQTKEMQPVGKIPDKGDIALRIKHLLAEVRPLLHSLLLFAPTLVMACLVGRRGTILPMALFALGIELAEFSFGYGFDSQDVFDLVNDGIGIAAAILVYQVLTRFKSPAWLIVSTAQQSLPLEQ
ncbi:MAG: hypothetical protein ABI162_20065 [Luteolibacter sp.]